MRYVAQSTTRWPTYSDADMDSRSLAVALLAATHGERWSVTTAAFSQLPSTTTALCGAPRS